MHTEIIVIGAGAAGLMAAYELSKSGKSVLVLEARERIGGRIHTIKDRSYGALELGAEFVHGDLPLTNTLIAAAGLPVTETGGEWIIVQGGTTTEDLGTSDWPLLMKKLKALEVDMSLQDFLEQHFADDKYAALKDRAISYAEGYDSADASRASVKALYQEWSKREEDEYRINEGYGGLMQYLMKTCMDKGVRILLEHKASNISTNEDVVEIQASGKTFTCEHAIVALPLGVLQAATNSLLKGTDPRYADALQELGVGDVIKFVCCFREAFWEKTHPDVGFILGRTPIPTWWTQYPIKNGILTGWLGGRSARSHADLDEGQLLDRAIESLSQLFSLPETYLRDNLDTHHIYNWSRDPYSLGSYAYTTIGAGAALQVLNTPIKGRTFFAGEYMFEGPEMGTVEAALYSGRMAAHKLLLPDGANDQ